MDIISQKITYIALVRLNEIPLPKLFMRHYQDLLVNTMKFASIEALQNPSGEKLVAIRFLNGLYDRENGGAIIINSVQVEERKMIITMEGLSQDAEECYYKLAEIYSEISGIKRENYLKPILISQESEIVAKLNFPFSKLISNTLLEYAENEATSHATLEIADAIIKPMSIKFKIDYIENSPKLKDHNITLSSKDFIIGSAVGYPTDEQVFYCKGPFNSNTHVKILADIEKIYSS
jgi:hypothetical protein